MNKTKKRLKKGGYTLVEMLIYILLTTILMVVVVDAFVFMSKTYQELSVSKNIATSAGTLLNRIAYEVRQAKTISVPQTSCINGQTCLTVVGDVTTNFFLSNNQMVVNGDALTGTGTAITSFVVNPISTSVSQGVLVRMTMDSGTGSSTQTRIFETTVMTRSF